jgi:phosphoglycerate dehydrogenase-like enzyme
MSTLPVESSSRGARPTAVAVTSRSFSRHPVLRERLLSRHQRVTFNDQGRVLNGAALVDFLRGHDKAITALERLDADVLAAVPELRVVSKYGVGLDSLDLHALQTRGVRLGWTAGINRRSVAELTIALAIALRRRLPLAVACVKAGHWEQVIGREFGGCTVGIIGCGHVGKEVALLARAFGCRVLAYDIQDYDDFYRRAAVQPADLSTLLSSSDIVTIHVPLTAATYHLVDATRLALMRHDAALINVARGGVIDEAALHEALCGGTLAGAALDVFESEPPGDRALIDLPQVIAMPHIGGSTAEAILAMGDAAIDGLENAKLPVEHGLL